MLVKEKAMTRARDALAAERETSATTKEPSAESQAYAQGARLHNLGTI
jgi:predicted dithiol-disulfide oxidoreductase (DUF899 family)